MTKHRGQLPQLNGGLFLIDGGMETTLIFHEGIDLPYFAAFNLLREQSGKQIIRKYYERYLAIAKANRVGFILEATTWRASSDWGEKLGYSAEALAAVNREGIELLTELRDEYESDDLPIVISGCIGPRGDGYDPGALMSPQEAEDYHAVQIRTFADTEAEMIAALTMNNINEAIGITRAAAAAGIPAVISFTLETDGKLPTGDSLKEAIESVDKATDNGPAYYMINCAHPTHFEGVVTSGEPWLDRIRGIRPNASKMSHAELDEAEELDDGNPQELGEQYGRLRKHLRNVNVIGGCCGTDHRHVEAMCKSSLATSDRAA